MSYGINTTESSDYPSIERCPHDKENPYAQISRDLIRNKNLSFKTRGFISFLLSFDKSWKISIPYFMKDQGIGRDAMTSMVNEAIEAGYLKREEYVQENGLKRWKYFISESPKFKKCLPHTGFPHTVFPNTENPDTKNKQVSTKVDKNKQKQKKRPAQTGLKFKHLT